MGGPPWPPLLAKRLSFGTEGRPRRTAHTQVHTDSRRVNGLYKPSRRLFVSGESGSSLAQYRSSEFRFSLVLDLSPESLSSSVEDRSSAPEHLPRARPSAQ